MKAKMNVSYSHKAAERFLIFLTLVSFFCCLLSLIRDLTIEKKEVINYLTIILTAVYSLFAFGIIAIFFNENTKTGTFIRMTVYFPIAAGIITYFLRSFVNFPVILVMSVAMIILYKKIFEAFFEHDGFESQCANKNNTTGLQKELYDYNMHLSGAAEGYRQNRTILTILAIILLILTGLTVSNNGSPSVLSVSLLFTYIICLYSNLFIYSHYVREAVYASDGFVNVFDFRFKIVGVSLVIFASCFLVSLLVSSNHSPLKLSYLLFFLKWFKKPETTEPYQYKDVVNQDLIAQRIKDLEIYQRAIDEGQDTKGTFTFAIICGVFFAAGILWYFISPFFKRAWRKYFRGVSFKAIFKNFFGHIKSVFRELFRKKSRFKVKSTESSRRFGKDMEEFIKFSRKSKEKKAELDRLTKQFMKIIDWGTSQGVEYTKNLAPAEYTQLLNNDNAVAAGVLFEKALYDKECLTKEEEKSFKDNVDCFIGRPSTSAGTLVIT